MKHAEKVALVKCQSYNQKEVDAAVKQALALINFEFTKGMRVLIKPNLVGSFPKNQIAITTNSAVIRAVCKILKRKKCKIFIGDSPFTSPNCAFKAAGVDKLGSYGKILVFERERQIRIRDKNAKILREFEIPRIMKEVDLVINMPKLKTHTLMRYTGAIKNLYGCIPGGLKQRLHNEARGEKEFSKVLVDIYQNIRPQLTIMDAVVGMDREGPSAGAPRRSDLILASRNGVALDIAATSMIGLKPRTVGMILEALRRKLYSGYDFELVGMQTLPRLNFIIPNSKQMTSTRSLLKNLFVEKPIILDRVRCARCGMCAKHCPGQAITLNPYPEFNKKKCIRCFCCVEICPQHALSLEK